MANALELRDYQSGFLDELRRGIREGQRRQILCAPTGAGKTVMAAALIAEAKAKGSKVVMVVDRIALARQTSTLLYSYGIYHGVSMGEMRFGWQEPIQVVSAQTSERRGWWPPADLLIIDECHMQRKAVVELVKNFPGPVIGLTATPFMRGLGRIYDRVVNATTTYSLIDQGYLSPLVVYQAREIDMADAATKSNGEWQDAEIENRSRGIIGDVVTTWVEKTLQHYSKPVPTLVFAATVKHGAEICDQFQSAGYDFRQVSYRSNDAEETINLFREDKVAGLVSVDALAKGFDVPTVQCIVDARPLRKSFATHIQKIGRGMRIAADKKDCLLLDHAGNYLGFYEQMDAFFRQGCDRLDSQEYHAKRREKKDRPEDMTCPACSMVVSIDSETCPACGTALRSKKHHVEIRAGEVKRVEFGKTAKNGRDYLKDHESVWSQLHAMGMVRKLNDRRAAFKWASGQYKSIYGEWPNLNNMRLIHDVTVDPRLKKRVQHNIIRWARSRASA